MHGGAKFEFELVGEGECSAEGTTVSAKTFEDCRDRCLSAAWDCQGFSWDPNTHLCNGFGDKPDASWADPAHPDANCYSRDGGPGSCPIPGLCPTLWKYELVAPGRCAFSYVTPPDDPADPFGFGHTPVPLSPASALQCEVLCVEAAHCFAYAWTEESRHCTLYWDWPTASEGGAETECNRLRPVEWRLSWSDCDAEEGMTERQYRCFAVDSDLQVADEQCERYLEEDRPEPDPDDEEARECQCELPTILLPGEYYVDCEGLDFIEIGDECELACEDGYHLTEGEHALVQCDEMAEIRWPERRCEPDADWLVQPWGPCVDGIERRDVQCVEIPTGVITDPSNCPGMEPENTRFCAEPADTPVVRCCSALGHCFDYPYLSDHYCCGGVYTRRENECCNAGIPGNNENGCFNTPDSGGTCEGLCNQT